MLTNFIRSGIVCVAMGVVATGCVAVDNDLEPGDPDISLERAYAESVYGDYQDAADGRISFEVATLDSGYLSDIAHHPINDLLGVPDYQLRSTSVGTDITEIAMQARDVDDEWSAPVDLARFDALGRPVGAGTYRLLAVSAALDGVVTEHRALEACWQAQGYCLVMDPVVWQLEAFTQDRRELLARGWKLEVETLKAEAVPGFAAVCSLNSNPSWGGKSLTWNGYSRTYKNLYGITVVEKSVGGQQTGVACYISGSSCLSSGFGYSNSSSCWANFGFSCDCENTGNYNGSTSNATKSWSETRCAHRAVLSAAVSFSVNGTGANFSINWDTSGSVDSNGGQLYDACSWH